MLKLARMRVNSPTHQHIPFKAARMQYLQRPLSACCFPIAYDSRETFMSLEKPQSRWRFGSCVAGAGGRNRLTDLQTEYDRPWERRQWHWAFPGGAWRRGGPRYSQKVLVQDYKWFSPTFTSKSREQFCAHQRGRAIVEAEQEQSSSVRRYTQDAYSSRYSVYCASVPANAATSAVLFEACDTGEWGYGETPRPGRIRSASKSLWRRRSARFVSDRSALGPNIVPARSRHATGRWANMGQLGGEEID